jgi:hypothetical protein
MAAAKKTQRKGKKKTQLNRKIPTCPLGLAGLRELIRRRRRPTILFQFWLARLWFYFIGQLMSYL